MIIDCIISISGDHVGPLKKKLEAGVEKEINLGIGNVRKPTAGETFLNFVGGLWFIYG